MASPFARPLFRKSPSSFGRARICASGTASTAIINPPFIHDECGCHALEQIKGIFRPRQRHQDRPAPAAMATVPLEFSEQRQPPHARRVAIQREPRGNFQPAGKRSWQRTIHRQGRPQFRPFVEQKADRPVRARYRVRTRPWRPPDPRAGYQHAAVLRLFRSSAHRRGRRQVPVYG
jgi:hypothetical protein